MTENTIAVFLAGHLALDRLRAELQTAETRVDSITTEVSVLGMDSEFLVTRDMALRVCDSALAGELPAEGLRLLAFIIITSERFTWGNDELLAQILHDWSCPEVNYALTPENLLRFRHWLDGTEIYPARPSAPTPSPSKLISRLVRKQL